MKKTFLSISILCLLPLLLINCKEKEEDTQKVTLSLSEILNTDWAINGQYWLIDDAGNRKDTVNYSFSDTIRVIDSSGIIKCIYKGKSTFKTENISFLGMRKPLNFVTQSASAFPIAVLNIFSGQWDYKGILSSPTGAPNRLIANAGSNTLQFEKNAAGDINLKVNLGNDKKGQFYIEEGVAIFKKAGNRYELQVRGSNRRQ